MVTPLLHSEITFGVRHRSFQQCHTPPKRSRKSHAGRPNTVLAKPAGYNIEGNGAPLRGLVSASNVDLVRRETIWSKEESGSP
jgi:hypothetical protein